MGMVPIIMEIFAKICKNGSSYKEKILWYLVWTWKWSHTYIEAIFSPYGNSSYSFRNHSHNVLEMVPIHCYGNHYCGSYPRENNSYKLWLWFLSAYGNSS